MVYNSDITACRTNRQLRLEVHEMKENEMFKINDNYLKLPGSYLFSTIAKKVQAFQAANPDKEIIP